MLSSLLLFSILAAPKAPADASAIAYIPQLDSVQQLLPFFSAAGTRSALLRPESWRSEAHPLVDIDVTSPQALASVGIDATASLTYSQLNETAVSCIRISDVDKYRKAADEKLARLGTLFEKVQNGVPIYASRDTLGRVSAAYALKGKDSCAISGRGKSVESQFPALAKAVTKTASSPGFALAAKLPGPLRLIDPERGALSLSANGLKLSVDGKSKGNSLPQFAGPGSSPFGSFSAKGMAVWRARIAKAELPRMVEQVVRRFPHGAALLPSARELAPLMTGNVALLISHVKVTTGLRTHEARFFALRSALLVEVSNPETVASLLEQLGPKGFGALTFSLEGSVLVVGNDVDVRTQAIAALAKSRGPQKHGMEFEIDPKLVAQGLQQVPLLEAVQAPELAGLIAAGSELGPLLLASESIEGFLDSAAGEQHSGQLNWQLEKIKFAPESQK